MKINEFCGKLDALLASKPEGAERYEVAVQALRQLFELQTDEVAIFAADIENQVLRFVWPPKLQKTGTIPISSRDSLATRTFRENKAVANNRFAAIYHASIFENVKHDSATAERPKPIQKILSAPLHGANGTPSGVVQVSRKGDDSNSAGPDFAREDLASLVEVVKTLGKYL